MNPRLKQTLILHPPNNEGRRECLTIFGNDDPYYSIAHCRANHAAFLQAGGRGEAITVSVTGNGNGHWAIEIPPLWQADVEGYLDAINRIDPVP